MKARCNHLPFFEVFSIGPYLNVIVLISTLDSVSNVSVFGYRFHGIRGDGRQKRKETLRFHRKTDTCGRGVVIRERSKYCSPVTVQSIKIKCVNN